MKCKMLPIFILSAICLTGTGCVKEQPESATVKMNVSMMPQRFEEGRISTDQAEEWAFAFTPDGKNLFLQRGNYEQYAIYEAHLQDGNWSEPIKSKLSPPVAGQDGDPFITPDGKRLFFASNRGDGGPKKDNDIWVSEKQGDGWTSPRNIGKPVNSNYQEWLPSVASNGNLYFQSDRPGGKGLIDLYMSKWKNGQYMEPVPLQGGVNTSANDESPFIAPDESYLLFARGDALYLSFQDNGSWSDPDRIALDGDSGKIKYSPYVTPDGKWLYYTSTWKGTADIYRVPFDVNEYKKK